MIKSPHTQQHLFSDPTAAALAEAMPLLIQPYQGKSSAIDEILNSRANEALILGNNGLYMIVTRPWVTAIIPIFSHDIPAPYGAVEPGISLRCNIIPEELIEESIRIFTEALPNESGTFIIWHEDKKTFRLESTNEITATPSHLHYYQPVLSSKEHIVLDMHSHGTAPAFWSATDDQDDRNHTRICAVLGSLDQGRENITSKVRFCCKGITINLKTNLMPIYPRKI